MNSIGWSILVVGCLPAIGFAWRGIALLRMRAVKPGRIISASGVVAMISFWVFAGGAPYLSSGLMKIFEEFDLELPRLTVLTVSILHLPYRFGLLWYPFVMIMGLCALTMPEIFFRRPQPE
jgi:hypothetical protein